MIGLYPTGASIRERIADGDGGYNSLPGRGVALARQADGAAMYT